jgi:ribonucleoside-triphosphate reductase
VTINLPRLAEKHKNNDINGFLYELEENVRNCARINNIKRKLIHEAINRGYHPLYTLGFIDINRQYSTVGINGFNECIEILGDNILNESGVELGLKIIDTINNENDNCQKRYKFPHNCEQIPAESASIKLAKKDKIMGYNKEYIMYSNQFIPLTTKADMLDRIKLQGIFDKHFSGGSVCHINIENKIKNPKKIIELMKTCAKKGVIYWSMNYIIQECENGHMISGKFDKCNICGGKIVNEYTRTVGFLTNTKNWIKERREHDYPNRQFY